MKTSLIALISILSLQFSLGQEKPSYAIVIHGGAGNISPQFISTERAEALSEKLT